MSPRLPNVGETPQKKVSVLTAVLLGVFITSIPAVGATKTDDLYIYGTPNGCLVRLKEPLKQGEHVRWNGDCIEEYASGVGVLTIFDSAGIVVSNMRVTMQRGVQGGRQIQIRESVVERPNLPGNWVKGSTAF